MHRIPAPFWLFLAWTGFVWGVRIKNADGSVGAVLLASTFIILALAVLVTRGDRRRQLLRWLAGWTALVWTVRVVDIVALSDHGVGFKVVHVALGVISVVLAVAALRSRRDALVAHS